MADDTDHGGYIHELQRTRIRCFGKVQPLQRAGLGDTGGSLSLMPDLHRRAQSLNDRRSLQDPEVWKMMQGRGFYVGLAFWPGGTVEDWGPAYDSDTQEFGLNPCNTTNDYNNTSQSQATYLASPCCTCCLQSHGALQPLPSTGPVLSLHTVT